MVESFTRKKVSSLTLGEKLLKLRTDARLHISDIAKATKIQAKYIEYLEKGEYRKLPADVYVKGYLRSYARYLDIDEDVLLKLYERERNITSNLQPALEPVKKGFQGSFRTYTITARSLVITAIVIIIGAVAVYLYTQFRNFTTDPLLTILDPSQNTEVTTNEITVRGKTDRGTQVTINDGAVFVNSDGTFEDKVSLQPGVNMISVHVVNRFDNEKTETLQVNANFAPPENLSSEDLALRQAEGEGLFRIALSIKSVPTKVTVVADGQTVFDDILGVGDPKIFEAKERLVVSAADGSQVLVQTKANTAAAPLSETAGPVTNKEFLKESGGNGGDGV